jgi:type II secretory pathway pseudopilin PulG
MCLEGQGNQRGYAMAALLVSIAVMTLLMSVAMPVWRTQAQREKEAELIFRGEQIARAINLYTRKMGGGNFPPTLEVLVQGRFLRKLYKDPMTEKGDWDLILAGSGVPGQGGPQQQPQPGRGRRGGPSTGLGAPPSINMGAAVQPQSPFSGRRGQGQAPSFGGQPGAGGRGGLMGVRSKSKESAFRLYKGSGTHYNEWQFLFSSVSNRPGVPGGQGAPGLPGRGRRGQPGIGPGGRGNVPDSGRPPRGSGPFQPGGGGIRRGPG